MNRFMNTGQTLYRQQNIIKSIEGGVQYSQGYRYDSDHTEAEGQQANKSLGRRRWQSNNKLR